MLEDGLESFPVFLIVQEGARHEELLAVYQTKRPEVVRLF